MLSLCLISTSVPSEAGMLSKAAKGAAVYGVIKSAPVVVKYVDKIERRSL